MRVLISLDSLEKDNALKVELLLAWPFALKTMLTKGELGVVRHSTWSYQFLLSKWEV